MNLGARFDIKVELTPEKLLYNKKSCAATKRWQKRNPEKVNENSKQWRDNNPEKIKEYDKRKYKKHKEKCNERSRQWYENNIEKVKEHNKHYYANNKEKERSKRWRDNNLEKVKETHRRSHLKRKYNLSLEEYNLMFEKQNGCCAICGKHQSNLKMILNVDHNHTTNKIRGLLCTKCNSFIACIDNDFNTLERIINYFNDYD